MLWLLAESLTADDVMKIVKAAQVAQASPALDPFSVAWWLQNFGPTGVILFLLGGAAWRVWLFSKPLLLRIGEGHVQLMSSLGASQAEHGSKLISIQSEQVQQRNLLNDIHHTILPNGTVK